MFICSSMHAKLLLLLLVESINSFFVNPHRIFNREYSRVKRDLSCPTENFSCEKPLDYEVTKQFLCTTNENCPEGHICCGDSCFTHKICKTGSENRVNCPLETHQCSTRLNFEDTKEFLCHNNQCGDGYKCCEDSCFHHKICKKVYNNGDEDVIPTRKILPTTTAVSTTTPTTTTVSTTPTTTLNTTASETSTTSTTASTTAPTNTAIISTNKISANSTISLSNVTASNDTSMMNSNEEVSSDDDGDDASNTDNKVINNETSTTPRKSLFAFRLL